MKTGFVTILGRPNVGKSTLINALVGRQVSIVTSKPQTTRNAIQGVYNGPNLQIVFVDTPGIHKPKVRLGESMNASAFSSLKEIDVLLLVVDAAQPFGAGDEYLISRIQLEKNIIVVFNKIDLTHVALIETLKARYRELLPQADQIEISAFKKVFLDDLLALIAKKLKSGPQYFPEGVYTNFPESFQIAEMIREQVLQLTHQEVPHSIAVHIDSIDVKPAGRVIKATIIVEKDSQKGILIGAAGKMIHKITVRAANTIEKNLGFSVQMELFVRVEKDWRNSLNRLKEFGYL